MNCSTNTRYIEIAADTIDRLLNAGYYVYYMPNTNKYCIHSDNNLLLRFNYRTVDVFINGKTKTNKIDKINNAIKINQILNILHFEFNIKVSKLNLFTVEFEIKDVRFKDKISVSHTMTKKANDVLKLLPKIFECEKSINHLCFIGEFEFFSKISPIDKKEKVYKAKYTSEIDLLTGQRSNNSLVCNFDNWNEIKKTYENNYWLIA